MVTRSMVDMKGKRLESTVTQHGRENVLMQMSQCSGRLDKERVVKQMNAKRYYSFRCF